MKSRRLMYLCKNMIISFYITFLQHLSRVMRYTLFDFLAVSSGARGRPRWGHGPSFTVWPRPQRGQGPDLFFWPRPQRGQGPDLSFWPRPQRGHGPNFVFWPRPQLGPWPHFTKCKNYWDFDVNYQILLFKNEYPLPFGWESSLKSS